MRVHLVDGTYELFRCFHGAPRAVGTDGAEVGAGRGVLATFAALMADPEVTHVAVAFDSLLAPPKPDPLESQVPLAVAIVRALGLTVWPSGRFQADELLASGARRYESTLGVEQIVLCTTDLDLAQCVRGERVVLLDRSRRRLTDEAAVRARFGVGPSQLPELFALVGDRSDGIAGLPGFGLRSAAALVAAFGSLEAIPDVATEWPAAIRGRARLAPTFAAQRRETLHARDLLALRDDVPIRDEVADLEWRGADRAAVQTLAARLGEPTAIDRITHWAS